MGTLCPQLGEDLCETSANSLVSWSLGACSAVVAVSVVNEPDKKLPESPMSPMSECSTILWLEYGISAISSCA